MTFPDFNKDFSTKEPVAQLRNTNDLKIRQLGDAAAKSGDGATLAFKLNQGRWCFW